MINLHERMLPTSAAIEPATSWSPVGQRIQLSHRGQVVFLVLLFICFCFVGVLLFLFFFFFNEYCLHQMNILKMLNHWQVMFTTTWTLTFTNLRTNSADNKLITFFFSYFSQKIGFDISCKLSPKEETIYMKCQNPIFWKICISKGCLLNFLHRRLSVKINTC